MNYFEPCCEDRLNVIYGEFNKTEELVQHDVQDLIIWLEEQPHLPNVKDEKWLTNILLRCKMNIEKARKHLDHYYQGRVEYTDIFSNRDPCAQETRACYNVVASIPAPALTPDGYRILYYKVSKHTMKDLPASDVLLSLYQMQMDVMTKEELSRGYIILVDLEYMSMAFSTLCFANLRRTLMMATGNRSSRLTNFQIRVISPGAMYIRRLFKKRVTETTERRTNIFQKLNRARIHKIYIMHVTPIMEVLVNIAKTMVKKELAERFLIWNKSPRELVEVLPKNVLSIDYGGDGKPVDELKKLWYEYITEFRDWFESEKDVKADHSKKPKTKNGMSSFFTKWF